MSTKALKQQVLIEAVESQPVLLEKEEGQERRRFKATFQRADVVNENGRIYPKAVLEKAIEEFKSLVEEGRAVGTLEHPEDGKTKVSDISHKIVDIYMEEDGTVVGVAECLNTTAGKELQALLEAGVKVGISSRGVGSVKVVEKDGRKVEEVQEDFRLEAFDVVYSPSTPGAFINEGKENDDRYVLIEREKLYDLAHKLIKETARIEREKAERRIQGLKEEYEESIDYKHSVAIQAIAKIVAPLISEEAQSFLKESEELKEKEKAYLQRIEELELEIYRREVAERYAVPLEQLAEAKSKGEIDRLIEEYKVRRKRKEPVRGFSKDKGDNPWTGKLSSIFIGGSKHGA